MKTLKKLIVAVACVGLSVTSAHAQVNLVGSYALGEASSVGVSSPFTPLIDTAGTANNITNFQSRSGGTPSIIASNLAAPGSTAALALVQESITRNSGWYAGANSYALTDNWAVDLWFLPTESTTSSQSHTLFDSNGNESNALNLELNINKINVVYGYSINSNRIAAGPDYTLNTWVRLTLFVLNGKVRLYVDGSLYTEAAGSYSAATIGLIRLGIGYQAYSGRGASGAWDSMKVYSFSGTDSISTIDAAIGVTSPQDQTVTVTNTPVTYDGSGHGATVTCSGGGTATNILTGGASSQTVAGAYDVTADCPAATGYKAGANIPADNQFVISKIDPTASITNTPQPYTGSAQTATVACLGGGTATLASGGTGTDAGSYPATVDCAASTNYNAKTGLSAGSFVINKVNPSCSVTGYTAIYDGNPHTATGSCTGVGADGTLAGLDLSGTTHTAIGTYASDPWTFTDASGNYNDASGTVSDAINSGVTTTTTVTCPTSVVYYGTPRTPCSAVTKAGTTTITSPSVTYASNTDVGTATATASYAGNATYAPSSDAKTFQITPAAAVVAKPSSRTWTVGQPSPSLGFTTSGFKGSDSWSSPGMTAPTCAAYADTAHTVPVTLDANTPAGTYYVFCTGAVVNGNYQGVSYYRDGTLTVIGLTVTGMTPTSGPIAGGTLVHIYGTGFIAPITVTVGGVPCANPVIQSGGKEVDCVTGANSAGPADVVVTTPAGSRTLTNGFRYVDPTVLTVTGISPTYGSIKGGTKVHIYGTGFSNPITVTIGGVACTKIDPAYVTSKGGREVDCYTGAHAAGLVDVVVTTSAGTVTLTNGYRYK